MTRSRFTTEQARGLYRKSPEALLIASEGQEMAVRARARRVAPCPELAALNDAYRVYAEAHGHLTAACWAAMRAHHNPKRLPTDKRRRDVAEQLFQERAA